MLCVMRGVCEVRMYGVCHVRCVRYMYVYMV